MSVAQMTSDSANKKQETQRLLETIRDSKKDREVDRLRPSKPELTAADAATLHKELKDFEIYMNEVKADNYRVWFRAARTVCSGRA